MSSNTRALCTLMCNMHVSVSPNMHHSINTCSHEIAYLCDCSLTTQHMAEASDSGHTSMEPAASPIDAGGL